MSALRLAYEGPTHKFEIQIPVCLLGKLDSDLFDFKGLIGSKEQEEQPVEERKEKTSTLLSKKTVGASKEKEGTKHGGEGITIATGIVLLSAMVLSALSD